MLPEHQSVSQERVNLNNNIHLFIEVKKYWWISNEMCEVGTKPELLEQLEAR